MSQQKRFDGTMLYSNPFFFFSSFFLLSIFCFFQVVFTQLEQQGGEAGGEGWLWKGIGIEVRKGGRGRGREGWVSECE